MGLLNVVTTVSPPLAISPVEWKVSTSSRWTAFDVAAVPAPGVVERLCDLGELQLAAFCKLSVPISTMLCST